MLPRCGSARLVRVEVARVVIADAAGQVQAERDELVAGPARTSRARRRLSADAPSVAERTTWSPSLRAARKSPTRTAPPSATARIVRYSQADADEAAARSRPLRDARDLRVRRRDRLRGRAAPSRSARARGLVSSEKPRSATSAGIDALTTSVAEPSRLSVRSSSYSVLRAEDAVAAVAATSSQPPRGRPAGPHATGSASPE